MIRQDQQQLTLDVRPPRRIDITIERLRRSFDELTKDQQAKLGDQYWSWWGVVVLVSEIRAMERAEEAVSEKAVASTADAYDRVVQPGQHPVDAMLRTFQAVVCK